MSHETQSIRRVLQIKSVRRNRTEVAVIDRDSGRLLRKIRLRR